MIETKEKCNEFLLSLNLVNDDMEDKLKIRKLYALSNNINGNYKKYYIPKRNGGKRLICEPNHTLKKVQKKILTNILEGFKVSNYAKGYVKGISLKENALPHINQKCILKLDIKDFFESISIMDVYNKVFKEEYFPKPIRMLLSNLVCLDEKLPEGAPTSAYISNLIMKDFDNTVGKYCEKNKVNFTRYSDDMTFSGNLNIKEIITLVKEELKTMGMQLNYKKIHVISKNKSQRVTGILVNKKINTLKNYRKQIRSDVYYIKKYGLTSHLNMINYNGDEVNYLISLIGKINFVLSINKTKEFLNYKKDMEKLCYTL